MDQLFILAEKKDGTAQFNYALALLKGNALTVYSNSETAIASSCPWSITESNFLKLSLFHFSFISLFSVSLYCVKK